MDDDDLDSLDLDAPMSSDDMDAIDNDDAYFNDEDLDSEDEDDDLEDETVDDSGSRPRIAKIRDVLKSWMNPKTWQKFKKLKILKSHVKSTDKNKKLALKLQLKKLGKLSLALLAFKFMVDHHQDEMTSDNEKTLLKLYADSKKKKQSGKKQAAPMLALASLKPGEVRQGMKNAGHLLSSAGNAVSDASQVNVAGMGKQVTGAGASMLNKLANMFGFNPAKIKSSFSQLFQELGRL